MLCASGVEFTGCPDQWSRTKSCYSACQGTMLTWARVCASLPPYTSREGQARSPARMRHWSRPRVASLAGVAPDLISMYFYPKAFTSGCTVEAHNFAEATPKINALGATVVGISNYNIETLKKFSVEACRDKFAVAADSGARIMKQYDAALWVKPDMADRISYVISPEGKVLYVYSSLSPDQHVENTLKAVEKWRASVPQ